MNDRLILSKFRFFRPQIEKYKNHIIQNLCLILNEFTVLSLAELTGLNPSLAVREHPLHALPVHVSAG